jgi:hypothetical protein
MSSLEVRYHLKSPLLVYAMAVFFILAPLGNILVSIVAFGVGPWWSPRTIVHFIGNTSWTDRYWLLLTFSAGFALLNRRKGAWLFAIGALLLTSVFNFYYGVQYSTRLAHGKYFFPALFMLSDVAIVVVLYHFRFPYLDRREAWWGIYPRYRCNLPLKSTGSSFTATVTNISRSGAFVEGASGQGPEVGNIIEVNLGTLSGLKGEVVHASDRGFGLEFNPTREQRREIAKLVRSLDGPPIGEVSPA